MMLPLLWFHIVRQGMTCGNNDEFKLISQICLAIHNTLLIRQLRMSVSNTRVFYVSSLHFACFIIHFLLLI
jgi:hypothetical protein